MRIVRWWRFCGVWMGWSLCAWGTIACIPRGKPEEVLAPRGQLVERAQMFNKLLRWNAYDRAKMLVSPQKRPDVVLQWEQDRGNLKITDYKVSDITETKPGKKAIVLVVIHRYRLPSVTLKRVLEQQEWESKEGYWYYMGVKKRVQKK